ncbi:hypothetical protein [Undibacterium luofuense]|uniref:Bacteriocin n=1 Tax=Undibacterium luofuense TaxID=2828733 RepID=A0A941DPH8_9BURK|nr:hypothetical protein [Undibacterium luofuense]MBR7783322.1 hypothetical protein [Undibacterium luofuense]
MQELNLSEVEAVGGGVEWGAVGTSALAGGLLGVMAGGVIGGITGALIGGGKEIFLQRVVPTASLAGRVEAL